MLKPGMLLVALRTYLNGGVTYSKVDLEKEVVGHRERRRWETTRRVADLDELAAADRARVKARNEIAKLCIATTWGFVCESAKEHKLRAAIVKAAQICDEHNASAEHTRVRVVAIPARIANDDAEAARAVREEVAAVLAAAEASALAGDVKAMRDAASRAKAMEGLLEEGGEAAGAVGDAVKALRKTARDVVRLVERKGEELEAVVTAERLRPVASARFLFTGGANREENS